MKKVTFIHCADLHLDSPMKGLRHLPEEIFHRLQESTFQAFTNLVDLAIRKQVDFMLIAGDLFDMENRSLRVQVRFRKEMERLNEKGIQVYVIHGNHDHLGGKWVRIEWPENVHVFGDQVEVKTFSKGGGPSVNIYGFSYPKRQVTERWIDQYIKNADADFHIGMLHGHYEGASDHSHYAPFQLADLQAKQFDYWALGHIHKRAVLANEPPVIYPGNPQGRNRKESGAKGCYFVSLSENGAHYEFYETHDVLWDEKTIDGSAITDFNGLYDLCVRAIEEVRAEHQAVVLSLEVTQLAVSNDEEAKELLEVLQDQEKNEKNFVWVRDVKIPPAAMFERTQFAQQGEFFQELFTRIDGFDSWEETLAPLYNHHMARKHLSQLSEEEKQRLLKDAETKLLALLAAD